MWWAALAEGAGSVLKSNKGGGGNSGGGGRSGGGNGSIGGGWGPAQHLAAESSATLSWSSPFVVGGAAVDRSAALGSLGGGGGNVMTMAVIGIAALLLVKGLK